MADIRAGTVVFDIRASTRRFTPAMRAARRQVDLLTARVAALQAQLSALGGAGALGALGGTAAITKATGEQAKASQRQVRAAQDIAKTNTSVARATTAVTRATKESTRATGEATRAIARQTNEVQKRSRAVVKAAQDEARAARAVPLAPVGGAATTIGQRRLQSIRIGQRGIPRVYTDPTTQAGLSGRTVVSIPPPIETRRSTQPFPAPPATVANLGQQRLQELRDAPLRDAARQRDVDRVNQALARQTNAAQAARERARGQQVAAGTVPPRIVGRRTSLQEAQAAQFAERQVRSILSSAATTQAAANIASNASVASAASAAVDRARQRVDSSRLGRGQFADGAFTNLAARERLAREDAAQQERAARLARQDRLDAERARDRADRIARQQQQDRDRAQGIRRSRRFGFGGPLAASVAGFGVPPGAVGGASLLAGGFIGGFALFSAARAVAHYASAWQDLQGDLGNFETNLLRIQDRFQLVNGALRDGIGSVTNFAAGSEVLQEALGNLAASLGAISDPDSPSGRRLRDLASRGADRAGGIINTLAGTPDRAATTATIVGGATTAAVGGFTANIIARPLAIGVGAVAKALAILPGPLGTVGRVLGRLAESAPQVATIFGTLAPFSEDLRDSFGDLRNALGLNIPNITKFGEAILKAATGATDFAAAAVRGIRRILGLGTGELSDRLLVDSINNASRRLREAREGTTEVTVPGGAAAGFARAGAPPGLFGPSPTPTSITVVDPAANERIRRATIDLDALLFRRNARRLVAQQAEGNAAINRANEEERQRRQQQAVRENQTSIAIAAEFFRQFEQRVDRIVERDTRIARAREQATPGVPPGTILAPTVPIFGALGGRAPGARDPLADFRPSAFGRGLGRTTSRSFDERGQFTGTSVRPENIGGRGFDILGRPTVGLGPEARGNITAQTELIDRAANTFFGRRTEVGRRRDEILRTLTLIQNERLRLENTNTENFTEQQKLQLEVNKQSLDEQLKNYQGHYSLLATEASAFSERARQLNTSIASGLSNAFLDGVTGVSTFADAFRRAGEAILRQLLDLQLQMVLLRSLGGKDGGGGLGQFLAGLLGLGIPNAGFNASRFRTAPGGRIPGQAGRHMGGPVTAGQSYLVGERGPELFRPSLSGEIVSNAELRGGGGTTVINNWYSNDTTAARATVEEMTPAILGLARRQSLADQNQLRTT